MLAQHLVLSFLTCLTLGSLFYLSFFAGRGSRLVIPLPPGWDKSATLAVNLEQVPSVQFKVYGSAIMTFDQPFPRPTIDFKEYKDFPALNNDTGDGNAYATLLCTRGGGRDDPFFAGVQSIVWRLLWSWWASRKYPVIVFVCPFVPQEFRDILAGQGAIIHELPLITGVRNNSAGTFNARWIDTYTKLNMWAFTQYKKIAFFDSDAFPIDNLDEVFDISESRVTINDSLSNLGSCGVYTFAGVLWFDPWKQAAEINGGFLVFSPSDCLHNLLITKCLLTDEYESDYMEQSFLNSALAFGPDGPMPAQALDDKYNLGSMHYNDRDHLLDAKVLHTKLWVQKWTDNNPFLRHRWDTDWYALCAFYNRKEFPVWRRLAKFPNVDLDTKRLYEFRDKDFLVNMTIERNVIDEEYRAAMVRMNMSEPVDPSWNL